jgi:hypothetical protein
MNPPNGEDIIGCRFRGDDGVDRHVWNVRDGLVHYFTKTPGSHWTPGHSFEAAPALKMFLESSRPIADQVEPSGSGDEMHGGPIRLADLGGDF